MRNGVLAAIVAGSIVLAGASSSAGATPTAGPTISTIAGGVGGPGPATKVALGASELAVSGSSAYLSDRLTVWRLNETTDQLAPYAGVGTVGSRRDGLSAVRAGVEVKGLATDGSGNLLLADDATPAARVRVVAGHTGSYYGQRMVGGGIYTIAGGGTSTADGVPARQARLGSAHDVTTDASGNVVITDDIANRIRVVAAKSGEYYGISMAAGDIYTVFAGDSASRLYQTAVDRWGNLVVADPGDGSVYVVAEKTGRFYGRAMTVGGVYPVAQISNSAPDGSSIIALDAVGNIVMANFTGGLVQIVAAINGRFYSQSMIAGHLYTVAGGGKSAADGVPALQASIGPMGVAVDASGNLMISDAATSNVRIVAVKTGLFYGRAMTVGDIYTVAGNGHRRYSGDGGPATDAEFNQPAGTTVDASGNILIADSYNCVVRVVAERTGTFYGRQMTRGNIYTIAGNGMQGNPAPLNGVPAVQAALNGPNGIAVDGVGNLIIADGRPEDYGGPIRIVAVRSGLFYGRRMVAGDIYTLTGTPAGNSVAVDHSGNLVIAGGLLGQGIVDVFAARTGRFYGQAMTAYRTYRVVGGNVPVCVRILTGPAIDAGVCGPVDVVVDAVGNLVLTDAGNKMVRVVPVKSGMYYGRSMRALNIYTVAGSSGSGPLGNGGSALKAQLSLPGAVAVDAAGNLVIADTGHDQIRVVALRSGTFYGLPMTVGDIYRISGTGEPAFWGDGGPAISAAMAGPVTITVTPGGGVLVSDDNRVRLIG